MRQRFPAFCHGLQCFFWHAMYVLPSASRLHHSNVRGHGKVRFHLLQSGECVAHNDAFSRLQCVKGLLTTPLMRLPDLTAVVLILSILHEIHVRLVVHVANLREHLGMVDLPLPGKPRIRTNSPREVRFAPSQPPWT